MTRIQNKLLRFGLRLLIAGFVGGTGIVICINVAGQMDSLSVVPKILIGFALIIIGGFILAPGIAGLLAEPTGAVYYPEAELREHEVVYREALLLHRRKQYPQAIEAYRKVLRKFPRRTFLYDRILQTAICNLQDFELAKSIMKEVDRRVQSRVERKRLHRFYQRLLKAYRSDPTYRPKIAIDPEALARELERKLQKKQIHDKLGK